MGLFKWFKRDLSSTPRSPYNKSIISDNNIKLSRNESYLKALNKFYKWRQKRLLLAAAAANYPSINELGGYFVESPHYRGHSSSSATSNSNNSSVSRIIYEEIDFNNDHEQYDSLETTRASAEQLAVLPHSADDNDSYKYNYVKKNYKPLEITDVHDESQLPEYAMPFEMGDDDFHVNTFEHTFKSDTDSEKYYSVYQDESKKHLVITDLDNSQGTVTSNKSGYTESNDANDFLLLAALKNFTDLMVCSKDQMKTLKSLSSEGRFRQAEIGAFEISYVEIEAKHNEAIHNDMETLRQLRHPHILLLMGITLDGNSRLDSVIYEPIRCSLYDSIHHKHQDTPLPVETCTKYTQQLISAVAYLHRMQFMHTNVCSRNVLLVPTMDAVKLGGFELSCKGDLAECSKQLHELNKVQTSTFHVDYRKQYTRHNYQAPELLSNSREYVRPTYQSDIYGLCITLWEMLNGCEPYHMFDYNELVKVFSLKTAFLPNYQEQRQMPFNELLEKGLELKWENRIGDTMTLSEALRKAATQHLHGDGVESMGLVKNNACSEGFYERTSTTKRKKGLPKISNLKTTNISASGLGDECVSPVNKSFHFSLKTPDDKNTSKTYNVNIRIKSSNQDSMQANTKTSNVKEKVNKFESLLSSPLQKSYEPQHSKGQTSWNITANSSKLLGDNQTNYTDSVCLEDFYIDDDFPNDCNFGDNIKLSLSHNEEFLF